MTGERRLETGGLWQDTDMARGSGDKVNHTKMEREYILQGIKNSRILNALIRTTRQERAGWSHCLLEASCTDLAGTRTFSLQL